MIRQDRIVRTITSEERRARLARRHRLIDGERAADPVEAARSVVCLHATDPATVYLSAWARVDGFELTDMDRCLYDDRSLVKQMAMRRTIFAFARDQLRPALAAAGARVAGAERRRLIRDVEKGGHRADGAGWLADAEAQVLEALAGGRELISSELREQLPAIDISLTFGAGKSWGGEMPVAPRILTILAAAGEIVRANNRGGWTVSRPSYALMDDWLGGPLEPPDPDEALTALVARWLAAFGPGTEADIKWWLGGTLTGVRKALASLEAVQVELEGSDALGYVLPDDLAEEPHTGPWAALLPSLDPTVMGWSERDWYLGPHRNRIFDRNGNPGHTAWLNGRIVGGWRQGDDGSVEVQPLEDVGAAGRKALDAEAARLGEWLAGQVVRPRYPSPLSAEQS